MAPQSVRRTKVPIIEYLKDRLYLAAFDHEPANTESSIHFSIDDTLPYNAFHHDFGPLHVGHLYRFAVSLHEILGDEDNKDSAVVFYSGTSPRARANAACILCCYMVLVQSWPPHLVLAPIAQADPPFMPFRDAGYSVADFTLSIQDIVYGVWRAKERGLLDLRKFNLEEYETYERVEMGDFNTIPPHFVASASPQFSGPEPASPSQLPTAVRNVLEYFVDNNVALVVRLNSHLYDAALFERRGVRHIDMIFEDGTCPDLDIVKRFIGACECVVADGGLVAVHCKAGLGRTGCLIGAYLIYTYQFTAAEVIGYMRFMRPGMVVGPQQQWLYLHQQEFREWKYTMTLGASSPSLAGYCPLVPIGSARGKLSSPRTPVRNILGEVTHNAALPAPTPGQPRKSPSPQANRTVSAGPSVLDDESGRGSSRARKRYVLTDAGLDDDGLSSSDENDLVMRKTRAATLSPSGQRSVSFSAVTTTTTTTIVSTTNAGLGSARAMRSSRRANSAAVTERVRNTSGIRKTSGKLKKAA
ncbi:protein-tyrosine phosphatase-like protein [Dipodascopsis tothii]|uniref:protein-tyrosine phosphatase-like protein n=1 Tax=Dipodascopsis tothii TaxID=44089 RepID=UPI0034CE96B4